MIKNSKIRGISQYSDAHYDPCHEFFVVGKGEKKGKKQVKCLQAHNLTTQIHMKNPSLI